MKWLVENWSLLVILAGVAVCVFIQGRKFAGLSTDEQIKMVKEWLLYAVIEAEKEFGSGTGALKLRAVYSQFCQVFPELSQVITFDSFANLVDDVLKEMKHLLEYNKDIACYVEGE